MANYIAYFRSSYFKVKDVDQFKKFCDDYGLEFITDEDKEHGTLYGFLQGDMSEGGIPNWIYDEDLDETVDVDFAQELAQHLAEGWAAEVREIGYEKMRYLIGFTMIVAWDGSVQTLSLDDIHSHANDWINNVKLTTCEY